MIAQSNGPEEYFPVSVIDGSGIETAFTLSQAEALRDGLAEAIAEICRHFRCTDETTAPGFRCHARGSVKQPDGTYMCRAHAKKAAK